MALAGYELLSRIERSSSLVNEDLTLETSMKLDEENERLRNE